jgi:hypothetical protein
MSLKRYRVYVVTTTVVPCEVIASSDDEVYDLFEDDPTNLRVVGNATTTEELRFGQSIPFVKREGE